MSRTARHGRGETAGPARSDGARLRIRRSRRLRGLTLRRYGRRPGAAYPWREPARSPRPRTTTWIGSPVRSQATAFSAWVST